MPHPQDIARSSRARPCTFLLPDRSEITIRPPGVDQVIACLPWLCWLLPLAGCAAPEPPNGCALAAANYRQTLAARGYLRAGIPARILAVQYAGHGIGHAALVYRLDEGWFVYDDASGTRPLGLPATRAFPDPLTAARAAFPGVAIVAASWY